MTEKERAVQKFLELWAQLNDEQKARILNKAQDMVEANKAAPRPVGGDRMNMNGGTLYRRIEDLVFILEAVDAHLDIATDIFLQGTDHQKKEAAKSMHGVITNIRHVWHKLNDVLGKIEDGVITETEATHERKQNP